MACHGDRRDMCDKCYRCDTCDRFSDSSTDRTGKHDDLSLSTRLCPKAQTEGDYISSMYMSWVVV